MGTDKTFAKIEKTRITGRFREGQGRRRHTVTAELHSLAGQHPYFSITMDTYRQAGNGRWVEDTFGCQHDEVRRLFPALAPYLRWHLVSTDGPMHYVANAVYWAGLNKEWCKGGKGDPPNREAFDETTLWGALPGDAARHPMDAACPACRSLKGPCSACIRENLPVMIDGRVGGDVAAAHRAAAERAAAACCGMDRAELAAALAARLPALLALFRADMDCLFGETPEGLAGVSEAFAFGGGAQ